MESDCSAPCPAEITDLCGGNHRLAVYNICMSCFFFLKLPFKYIMNVFVFIYNILIQTYIFFLFGEISGTSLTPITINEHK